MELLAEHDAAGANTNESKSSGVITSSKVERKDSEGDGTAEGVEVVGEVAVSDGGGVFVVALESLDLGAEERGGRGAVVVDGPVVEAGGEVGDGEGKEGGAKRWEKIK